MMHSRSSPVSAGQALTIRKTGRQIKAVIAQRIDLVRHRLAGRNAVLNKFLEDGVLVRAYLVRAAGERVWTQNGQVPIARFDDDDTEVDPEQLVQLQEVCERVSYLERELRRLRLLLAHLDDERPFDLTPQEFLDLGFEA